MFKNYMDKHYKQLVYSSVLVDFTKKKNYYSIPLIYFESAPFFLWV
jgi:hypothetical protein